VRILLRPAILVEFTQGQAFFHQRPSPGIAYAAGDHGALPKFEHDALDILALGQIESFAKPAELILLRRGEPWGQRDEPVIAGRNAREPELAALVGPRLQVGPRIRRH